MLIRRLLTAICTFFALHLTAGATASDNEDDESFLTRAVYADGRLWVLSDAGVLSSLVEGEREWHQAVLPEPVYDICRTQRSELFAITGERENPDRWTMRRWHADAWATERDISAIDEYPLALHCGAEGVALLTSRRLIDVGGKTIDVSWPEHGLRGRITSVLEVLEGVLIGASAGEWGGGLYRMDRKTGKIASVGRNVSGRPCGGPPNGECDPVNALGALPWKPGCVAAAIGLAHLSEHGRIVEVCGDEVTRLYYDADPGAVAMGGGIDEPFETVAFFGLVSSPEAIFAVSSEELYRIDAAGSVTVTAMPDFEDIGNVQVSFARSDFVLVLEEVGQRDEFSDSTPMLVPR